MIDLEKIKPMLSYIAMASHMGDVNNELPELTKALGLPEPVWDEDWECFRFEWDEKEDE